MNAGVTIVVLTEDDGPDPSVEALRQQVPDALLITADCPTAAICATISGLRPTPPLVLAATGRSALHLPGVALAQRSAHRLVVEYLLLDPVIPPVTDSWPDARVTVVCGVDTEASLQSRLRGWDVLRPEELPTWSPSR